MLDITLLIMLVFIVLFSFIAFKVVKTVLKLTFLITILTIIILGLFSYFVYQDLGDLKQNFSSNDNLLILKNNDQLLTGVEINFEKLSKAADSGEMDLYKPLSQGNIDEYNTHYAAEEYDIILNDNYKILFIDYQTFTDIQDMEYMKKTFSNTEILQVLESQNPKELLSKKGISLKSTVDIKPSIFALLINEKIKKQQSTFLLTEIKNKNINVYPETVTFKIIKYIPVDFMQDQLAKISEKVKQEAEE